MADVSLPRQEQKLYDALDQSGDVSIDRLFGVLYPESLAGFVLPRRKQQVVGGWVSRLNRSLERHEAALRVRTGDARRSYRMERVGAAV